MSNDVFQLKDELQILNGRIQAERNDEVRHGLQRGRLEAERTQLLVRLMDAMSAPATPSTPAAPPTHSVLVSAAPVPPVHETTASVSAPGRQRHKPAGLPTIVEMVVGVLEGEDDGMRPCDITKIARRKWWPGLRLAAVGAAAWKLHGQGRLAKDGHRYRLNGHAGE
jgi:hypothetical protein